MADNKLIKILVDKGVEKTTQITVTRDQAKQIYEQLKKELE